MPIESVRFEAALEILFVNSVSDSAGGASSAVTLANALSSAGHNVALICNRRADLAERIKPRDGLTVQPIRFGPDFDPLTSATLARAARNARADIVLADRRKDVKLLVAARIFGLSAPIVHRHGAPSVLRDSPLYRLIWRRLAAMIVNSAAMRAALLEATPWLGHIPIHVIHNGVDTHRFRPRPEARAATRAQLDIGSDAFVVAFAGVLQPRKRVSLIVRAAGELPPSARPHLLLIGDGPERDALEAEARRLDVPATFTGHRDDVHVLIAAADIGVHLSSAEGFANSVLECLASGLPVIATREHSHPEQIDNEVTGLLVRAEVSAVTAAMDRLRTDGALRDALGRAARKAVIERFGIEAMIRRYLDVLESVG